MSRLITNSNLKLEFSGRIDLYRLVLEIGGTLRKDFKAALRHKFDIKSKSLNRRFIITLLIYSTGSIIITNLPFLIDSELNNECVQAEINTKLFEKVKVITKFISCKSNRRVKIHGSKEHDTFNLSRFNLICSFNNVTLSFKSLQFATQLTLKSLDTIADSIQHKMPGFNAYTIDNRDFFPAAKLFVVGTPETGVKINFTIYKQFGQVNVTGIKSFSDINVLKSVMLCLLEP